MHYVAYYRRELMGPGKMDVADPSVQLGVFISKTLWSWPSCIEEVVPSVQSA
jgi:Putative peptidase family